ncbi:MAG: hypothetical protein NT094_00015 [Candidatus Staskawiczbacteria bacterium]|nr:hypothetical protein [Candidatus Staskawiczbacteria bacterium]
MIKKILIGILIVIILVVAGISYLVWTSENDCLDAGSKVYLEKQYLSEEGNHIIASISGCRPKREIKVNDVFKKVSKDEFERFLKDYNRECNNCLIEISRQFGGKFVSDYTTGKVIESFFHDLTK